MKKLLSVLLLAVFLLGYAGSEEEGSFYEVETLISLNEGEEAVVVVPQTCYSGGTVWRGSTKKELTGACALHCAAVMVSNATGVIQDVQGVTAVNNNGRKSPSSWTNFVAWGKVGNAYGVAFESIDLLSYVKKNKKKGMSEDEIRYLKLEKICDTLQSYGQNVGLVIHFNSSKKLNGSGKRHAMVLLGYIKKDGKIVDLLMNDSSIDAPEGVCVRLTESTVAHSMMGEEKSKAAGERLVYLLMDYAVSCRYIAENENETK